jgi:4-hydroxybenzoate polyprenyltransferase
LFEFFALRNNPILYVDALNQIWLIGLIVVAYALFAFLVTLVREIIKDVEDMEGDKKGDYKTLAIAKGKEQAKKLAVFIHGSTFLFLAVCQYYLYVNGYKLVFWYLLVAVQSLFLFVLYYMLKAKSKDEYHFLSTAMKIIMVAGILSMQIFYITQ